MYVHKRGKEREPPAASSLRTVKSFLKRLLHQKYNRTDIDIDNLTRYHHAVEQLKKEIQLAGKNKIVSCSTVSDRDQRFLLQLFRHYKSHARILSLKMVWDFWNMGAFVGGQSKKKSPLPRSWRNMENMCKLKEW